MSRIDVALRGFLIPDERLSFDALNASDSSYNEADPTPGGVVPQSDWSRVLLEVTGEQDADYDLACIQGGYPGKGPGCRWAYGSDGAATTAYKGWTPPQIILNAERVAWGSTYTDPFALTIPSTQDVIVSYAGDGKLWSHSSRSFGGVLGIPSGSHTTNPMVVLPGDGERVVAYVWPSASAGVNPSAVFASSPYNSWDNYAENVLASSILVTSYYKSSATVASEDILLTVEIDRSGTDRVVAWASGDFGVSFTQTADNTTADLGDAHEVLALASGKVLWIYRETSGNTPTAVRVPSVGMTLRTTPRSRSAPQPSRATSRPGSMMTVWSTSSGMSVRMACSTSGTPETRARPGRATSSPPTIPTT